MRHLTTTMKPGLWRLGGLRLYSSRQNSQGYVDDIKDYNKEHLYPKNGQFVQSSTEILQGTERPSPINVELNKYAPFKHKPTHNDLVAQVQFRSFSHDDMDFFVDFALRAAFYLKIPVVGPSYMPKRTQRWTVIKSPFVHAKAKQNFERITYRRMLKVYDTNPDLIQIFLATLAKYSIGGVGIDAKLFNYESIDDVMKLASPSYEESPLNIRNAHLSSADQELADTVLRILKDPAFEQHLESDTIEKLAKSNGNLMDEGEVNGRQSKRTSDRNSNEEKTGRADQRAKAKVEPKAEAKEEKLETKAEVEEKKVEAKAEAKEKKVKINAEAKEEKVETKAEVEEMKVEAKAEVEEKKVEAKAEVEEKKVEIKAEAKEEKGETGAAAKEDNTKAKEENINENVAQGAADAKK